MDVKDFLPHTFKLVAGGGTDVRHGLCFMQLVSFMSGDKNINASPASASPHLTMFGVHLNDSAPTKLRQKLLPLACAMVGTRTDDSAIMLAREKIIADCAKEMHKIFKRRGPMNFLERRAIQREIAELMHNTSYTQAMANMIHVTKSRVELQTELFELAFAALDKAIKAGPHSGMPEKQIVKNLNRRVEHGLTVKEIMSASYPPTVMATTN